MDGESTSEAIMANGAVKKMFKILIGDNETKAKYVAQIILAIAQHYHY